MAIFKKNPSMFKIRIVTVMILGLVMTVMGFSSVIGAVRFRSDIEKSYEQGINYIPEMKHSDFQNGLNVYGYVEWVYGCFCEETTTREKYGVEVSSSVTGGYYMMPVWDEATDEERYLTILVHNQNSMQTLDAITDDTWNYIDGYDVDWHEFYMFGKVKPLEEDVREYMIDAFRQGEWFDSYDEATMNKYIIPYQVEEYFPDNAYKGGWIMAGIGLAFLVIFAVIFILAFMRGKKNSGENGSFAYQPPQSFAAPANSADVQQSPYAAAQSYPQIKQPDVNPDDFFNKPRETPSDFSGKQTVSGSYNTNAPAAAATASAEPVFSEAPSASSEPVFAEAPAVSGISASDAAPASYESPDMEGLNTDDLNMDILDIYDNSPAVSDSSDFDTVSAESEYISPEENE